MLRFGTTSLTRAASKATNITKNGKLVLSKTNNNLLSYHNVRNNIITGDVRVIMGLQQQQQLLRAFSSNTNKNENKTSSGEDNDGEDRKELVLTPGQKVVVGTRLMMYAGIAVLASICGYYIIKELLPTKMSPNSVFDNAFALIKGNNEVNRSLGGPLKAYGKNSMNSVYLISFANICFVFNCILQDVITEVIVKVEEIL